MSDFLDCAKELERCRQQQSAADELQQRMDATMDQQAMWDAIEGQRIGGETGVPVEVLGYNNELGGYLVEERNGNISLMRSRSNSGIPTGAIIPAECDELVTPPAWALSGLEQYSRTRRSGTFRIAYSITYRAGGCDVATEIWLGGTDNKLLKRYERGEPYTASFDYYRNRDGIVRPLSEFNYSSEYSDREIQDLSLTGGASPSLSASNSGAGDSPAGAGWGTGIFRLYPEIPDDNHTYRVFGSVIYTASASGSTGALGSNFFLLDAIASQNGAGSTSGSSSFNQCNTITIEMRMNGTVTNESDGGSNINVSANTSSLQLALEPRPELLYLANENGTYYAAVLYSQAPGVMAVDYFIDGELSDAFTLDNPSTATDWRSSLIGLDRDYVAPTTGDPCVDSYRAEPWINLYQATLKSVEEESLNQLLTANATIKVTVQPAATGETCTLGDSTIEQRFAIAVQPPNPEPGQTAETTILWAAP